jgi:hypothetical protein
VIDPGVRVVIAMGTFTAGDDSSLHALIRGFRAGDKGAFRTAFEAVADALARERAALPERCVLVAVPAHRPGQSRRPIDVLVSELATVQGWAAPAEPPLRRIEPVPEAKLGCTGIADPTRSLHWTPQMYADGVVLIDDVVRSGGTIRSCVRAIQSGSVGASTVLIIGLARAIETGGRPGAASDAEPSHQ